MIYTLVWLAYGVLVIMIWFEPYLGLTLTKTLAKEVTEAYKDL